MHKSLIIFPALFSSFFSFSTDLQNRYALNNIICASQWTAEAIINDACLRLCYGKNQYKCLCNLTTINLAEVRVSEDPYPVIWGYLNQQVIFEIQKRQKRNTLSADTQSLIYSYVLRSMLACALDNNQCSSHFFNWYINKAHEGVLLTPLDYDEPDLNHILLHLQTNDPHTKMLIARYMGCKYRCHYKKFFNTSTIQLAENRGLSQTGQFIRTVISWQKSSRNQ